MKYLTPTVTVQAAKKTTEQQVIDVMGGLGMDRMQAVNHVLSLHIIQKRFLQQQNRFPTVDWFLLSGIHGQEKGQQS